MTGTCAPRRGIQVNETVVCEGPLNETKSTYRQAKIFSCERVDFRSPDVHVHRHQKKRMCCHLSDNERFALMPNFSERYDKSRNVFIYS